MCGILRRAVRVGRIKMSSVIVILASIQEGPGCKIVRAFDFSVPICLRSHEVSALSYTVGCR